MLASSQIKICRRAEGPSLWMISRHTERSLCIKLGRLLTQIPLQRHSKINKEAPAKPSPGEGTLCPAGTGTRTECGDLWKRGALFTLGFQEFLESVLLPCHLGFLGRGPRISEWTQRVGGLLGLDWLTSLREPGHRKGRDPAPPWVQGGDSLEIGPQDSPLRSAAERLSRASRLTATLPWHSGLILICTKTKRKWEKKRDKSLALSPESRARWRVLGELPEAGPDARVYREHGTPGNSGRTDQSEGGGNRSQESWDRVWGRCGFLLRVYLLI